MVYHLAWGGDPNAPYREPSRLPNVQEAAQKVIGGHQDMLMMALHSADEEEWLLDVRRPTSSLLTRIRRQLEGIRPVV